MNTNKHSIGVVNMIKRFSGQDLFLIVLAITVLCFIYTVLLVTGNKATTLNDLDEQDIKISATNMELMEEYDESREQSYTYLFGSNRQ